MTTHPRPPVSGRAQKLLSFVLDLMEAGRISDEDARVVVGVYSDFLAAQGYHSPEELAGAIVAGRYPDAGAVRHGIHLMRSKLLDLHPELESELRRFDARAR
jgi:hypothetical protein